MVHNTSDNEPTGLETEDHLLLRARMVRSYEAHWTPPIRDWPVLHTLILKPPKWRGDKWLVVCKATTEAGEMVGFHKGTTIMAAIAGALQRVFSGHMAWKVETPYRPPRG